MCDHLVRRARWGVVLRRALPTLTALSLLATVVLLPRMGLDKIEGAWTLLYHVPTLLLAGAFMLQEMPRFEIPPWPKRSRRVPSVTRELGFGACSA